jgi:hypothetical protein
MIIYMFTVVLDSNAIHSDPWLTSIPGKKLIQLAEDAACVVLYPQVVIDELRRQRREAAERAHAQAAKAVDDMAKAGVDVSVTVVDLKASFDKITADIDAAFDAVLAKKNIAAAPVPTVTVPDLFGRDLARRRPFMEIEVQQKKKSVGFRDVLIWETVLASLSPQSGHEKLLFVTADKGFLSEDSKALHQDLLQDLDDRGVARDRVVSVKNIPHAIAEVEAAAAYAALVKAATDGLYALVDQDISIQTVYGGDDGYPDFVKFTMPPVESGFISYIDQTTEFAFVEKGEIVTGTAEALLTIEGALYKADWYMDAESVTIQGELNDHYFETSSEVEVLVVVEIKASGDTAEVVSISLEDPPIGASALGGAEAEG